jgi:hypothetical protein
VAAENAMLAAAIEGYRFGLKRTDVPVYPRKPLEAPTGIEPVTSSVHAVEPNLWAWIARQARSTVPLYRSRFDLEELA